jgi:hypothetical protein
MEGCILLSNLILKISANNNDSPLTCKVTRPVSKQSNGTIVDKAIYYIKISKPFKITSETTLKASTKDRTKQKWIYLSLLNHF